MFREIPSGGPWITEKEIEYVTDACANGWYKNWNSYLDKFEQAVAGYIGCRFAISTSSCTGAIHIAMKALGIGPGDEVIVPENTWIGGITGICYEGATPVFVDVEQDTWCMDPRKFEAAITEQTKAVIPVHMYGHPANLPVIQSIAVTYGIAVIEDAAPGIGSKVDNRMAGSFGKAATFSFQGAKPLVTGEGGMLVTNDEDFYERACYYADHCRDSSKVLYNTDIGLKYKMSNIQAALGLAQIERADEIINKRREIFFWYRDRLADIEGLAMNVERPGYWNNYYVPSIVIDDKFNISTGAIMQELDKVGIRTRPFFRCISKFPMFKAAETPIADYLSTRGINLPAATKLSEDDVDYVANAVRRILLSGN